MRVEEAGTRQTALRQAALTSFTSMAQPKLMVAPDELGAWWGWWSCRRKCCEPGSSDEAVAREKARAKARGRQRGEE